jgi:hypothetical protein
MAELTLHEKLIDIQQRLKVPKDKRNEYSTSKFMYRNLEAIEEAVKPILAEHKLTLTFNDEVIAVGDRVFVKATATLLDGVDQIHVSAFAQHAIDKKGMDDAQLTGSCSSYARKYAAGGLFLIDETKDADSMDNSAPKVDLLPKAKSTINAKLEELDYTSNEDKKAKIYAILGKTTISNLNDAEKVMDVLEEQNV